MCCSDLHLRTEAHPPRGVSSVGGRWPPAESLPRDLLIITHNYNNLRLMAGHCWGYKALALFSLQDMFAGPPQVQSSPWDGWGLCATAPEYNPPPRPVCFPSPLHSSVPQRAPHPDLQANFCPRISVPTPSRLLLGQNLDSCQMAITI